MSLLKADHTRVLQASDLRGRVINASEASLFRPGLRPIQGLGAFLGPYRGPREVTKRGLNRKFSPNENGPSLCTRAASPFDKMEERIWQ